MTYQHNKAIIDKALHLLNPEATPDMVDAVWQATPNMANIFVAAAGEQIFNDDNDKRDKAYRRACKDAVRCRDMARKLGWFAARKVCADENVNAWFVGPLGVVVDVMDKQWWIKVCDARGKYRGYVSLDATDSQGFLTDSPDSMFDIISLIPANDDDDKSRIVKGLEPGHNRVKEYERRRVAVDRDVLRDGLCRAIDEVAWRVV